ncbi:MAG: hypothetical protein LBM94_05655 [Propionibacteriaceae bacterium]|nr:hypothetical protein [Propionibacteriaceae bacterium]
MNAMTTTYLNMTTAIRELQAKSERGLSQSTENAILLAGAVAVAGIIITVITAYVKSHLPS